VYTIEQVELLNKLMEVADAADAAYESQRTAQLAWAAPAYASDKVVDLKG